VAAYLRFARLPWWASSEAGTVWGDLLYDRSADLEFAELQVPHEPGACPKHVPDWTPPSRRRECSDRKALTHWAPGWLFVARRDEEEYAVIF